MVKVWAIQWRRHQGCVDDGWCYRDQAVADNGRDPVHGERRRLAVQVGLSVEMGEGVRP
ncbi:MAG: hypothetical protein HND44_04190 [Chloroflexi bacterium]|nr:hypothetical protein [Ardenticatenaceae bacterium]NOG33765.1 hypothetical protein [Chloroflexota bacterium]